jgi:DNA modification methylase
VGFVSKKGVGDWKQGVNEPVQGIARCRDYVEVGTGKVDKSKENSHPAQYPEQLSSWIIRLLSPENGTVLDPFMGSGTTAISAIKNNRKYVGIELSPEYCQIAENRIHSIAF